MKDIVISLLLSTMLFSSTALAHPQQPAANPNQQAKPGQNDSRKEERELRQLAEELLNGRQITIRVYKDWRTDPAAFELVSVPLSGLTVNLTSIESAFGQMSDSTVIVALGEDQKDEAVAAVVSDFIYAELYRSGSHFSIWPERFDSLEPKCWLFKDALDNPIPNATLQIFVTGRSGTGPRVWIKNANLDEQARLKSFKVSPQFLEISFTVFHPDYSSTPTKPWASHTRTDNHGNRCHTIPVLPKDKWCVFNDALGAPIPAATVEIFSTQTWKLDGSVCIAKARLDEEARLEPPRSNPRLRACCLVLSHPDYGTALAEPRATMAADELLTSCTVPLVRIGARADKRSIWGTVVDTQGNPVKAALLTCISVWTLDGARISTNPYWPCRTITDDLGKFAMHVPLQKSGDKTSEPVPLAANYTVRVEAPKALCLRYWLAEVPSGQETTITLLPAPSESYFPTLIFEDEFGPVTDPNMLKHVRLKVERSGGGSWHPPTYNDWIKIGRFEPGTYYATADWNGKHYVCEPIDLTREWPDTVVFQMKVPQEVDIIYEGQVVHGVTGQPMPGAIVMYRADQTADASGLEPEQWDAIHSVSPPLDPNDPALTPLREIFKFTKIARTDMNGSFQIALRHGNITKHANFVAVEKDYLGAQQQLTYTVPVENNLPSRPKFERKEFEPDEAGCVTLPPMRLFPAGTIVVEPNIPNQAKLLEPDIPNQAKYPEIRLLWSTSKDDNTPWLEDLWAPPRHNKGGSMVRKYELQPNQLQTAYVPAGVELTIEIYMLLQSEWAPVVIRGIKLQQGQVLDLGRLDFQPNMKVAVKVIDSTGQPVPGVTVWLSTEGAYHGPKAVSTQDGMAVINIPPYSKGEFSVVYYDKLTSTTLREAIPYEVAGEDDAGRQFTLRLSDEMISSLFE